MSGGDSVWEAWEETADRVLVTLTAPQSLLVAMALYRLGEAWESGALDEEHASVLEEYDVQLRDVQVLRDRLRAELVDQHKV